MGHADDRAWGPPWGSGPPRGLGAPPGLGPPSWRSGARTGGPPRALLVLGPVLLALVQVGGSFGAQHAQPQRRPVDALGVLLLLVGPAALIGLRRSTQALLVVVGAATAVYLAAGYPYGPVFASLAAAELVAIVRGQRLLAWLVAGAVLLADAASRVIAHRAQWSWASQLGVLAWVVVILALAELARGRAERAASYRQAAQERRRRQAGDERLRIAQELHDVVAHHMSLINVQAGVALHLADRRPEQVEPALVAIRDASKEALTELRSLIDVLRADDAPAPRNPIATLSSLDDMVARSRQANLEVVKRVSGEPRELPAAVELAAYRIVQEAITNIVRHARATRATVDLDYGADVLAVRIEDNGSGGPTLGSLMQGNGISGMHERARALGGQLEIRPSNLGGLLVEAHLPAERP